LIESGSKFSERLIQGLELLEKGEKDFNFDCAHHVHSSGSPEHSTHTIVARNEQTAHAIFLLVQLVTAPIIVRNGKVLMNTFTRKCGLRQSFSTVTAADVKDWNQLLALVVQDTLPLVAENNEYEEDEGLDFFNQEDSALFGLNPIKGVDEASRMVPANYLASVISRVIFPHSSERESSKICAASSITTPDEAYPSSESDESSRVSPAPQFKAPVSSIAPVEEKWRSAKEKALEALFEHVAEQRDEEVIYEGTGHYPIHQDPHEAFALYNTRLHSREGRNPAFTLGGLAH
jgi:hypothetical protein